MKNYKFCPICKCVLTKTKDGICCRLSCNNCGWVYYHNPLPSVAAFVRNDNGEILLIKRGVAPGKGKWALPSGFIEQNELPEEAVLRELREETNIKGTLKHLIGVYTEPTKLYGNILLIGYEINFVWGKPKPGSDTEETKFFRVDKLPVIHFASHRAIIKDGIAKNGNKISFIEVLKSKITEATITRTQLFYKGSMGIDSKIMEAAKLVPGEKVQVLNYNNGERLETYTIEEKSGSGKIILYGPASKKGKVGDKLCILSYIFINTPEAKKIKPVIVILNKRNRIKRRPI
ncbi:Aspartate 1-decarboxylase [subsurface metagenome]